MDLFFPHLYEKLSHLRELIPYRVWLVFFVPVNWLVPKPSWFVPLWVLAHIGLFRPYQWKLDVLAGKSKSGRYQKKKKSKKSLVFVIIATHHHVAGHFHVSCHFHFVNCSIPTCFSFFFLAFSLLRSLFFFDFSASLFFGISSFERLSLYLVLYARVPLPREYWSL